MRIVLDTDKKTITVPWNYQQKLEEYNAMVMEISGDASKKKTFKSLERVHGGQRQALDYRKEALYLPCKVQTGSLVQRLIWVRQE